MRLLLGRRRAAKLHARGDDGFTLIELVVAMFIVFAVMTAMIGLFVGSLSTVSQSKQRQTATALATQTLERLRALPYDVIKIGVNKSTAAFTADPNIADKTTTPRLLPGIGGIDETLLVSTAQATAPLSNHRVVTNVSGVRYTVGVYVTQAATPQPAYNLTALVTYKTVASKGTKTVIQRSTAFSPSGCLSTATHPFAGPCQASFSALAGATAGSIVISNPDDPEADIAGLAGQAIGLELPELSASTGIEQTTTITAGVKTMAAIATNGATTTSGGQTAKTAADSDPSSSAAAASDSKTAPAQTSAAQSLAGAIGTATATPTTADTGNAASQVTAGATGCVATDGTAIASAQPCASGTVRGQGTMGSVSVDLSGTAAVRNLPVFSPITVGAAAAESRSMAGRFTAASTAACTGVAPPNCAHASVTRTLGDVTVGSLPPRTGTDTGPAAYTNSFSVAGLKETARAESGVGARAAVMTRDAGTLRYWNGTGYSTVTMSTVAADTTYDPPAVAMSYKAAAGLGYVGITVDSVIRVSKPRLTTASPAGCNPLACTQQATSASSVTADTLYVVTLSGVEQTRFVVRTNLGALIAESSYRAAPLA